MFFYPIIIFHLWISTFDYQNNMHMAKVPKMKCNDGTRYNTFPCNSIFISLLLTNIRDMLTPSVIGPRNLINFIP